MAKKKNTLELTPAQQAAIADAFTRAIRETREAYAEFEDMTPEEWRALKADAAKERRRPPPPRPNRSRFSDWKLLKLEEGYRRHFQNKYGRAPLRREIHKFISKATGLEPTTCRDRLLKARNNKG
jgi:hypothetical protein